MYGAAAAGMTPDQLNMLNNYYGRQFLESGGGFPAGMMGGGRPG
jgi:hypothetical protein